MAFGGSVKLTGESEYRQAIQRCTQDLQNMSSALKTQATNFSASDKSLSSSVAKQKELNDAINKQQQAVNSAKSTLAGYSTEMQKQTTLHNQLNKEYKNAVLELDRIKKSSGENSAEYKKQAQVVAELGNKLTDSAMKLDENKSAMASLKSEINNSNKAINTAKKELDELGNEAEESGEKAKKGGEGFTVFKGILANLGSQAIMSAINGLKSLGGSIVNVGKQAVNSYADYEQLVGGVETLFKDSAGIVESYADNAYKTAGMSANEYMETVTSFSASLLQSLGGDTEKAAKVGDMAISDMSDNANKMGTSMEMIQNAYQGFAKQNYTMLDNLKLGYGGTKSEMERLLADAEKFSGVKYDISSLSDVYEAIHVVQQEMGITGTTAAEASQTIQGSTAAMKSAWQNMLTGMANENADFGQLATNFVESVVTVAQNLIPRITQVIQGVSDTITTMLPQLINEIVPLIQQNLPVIIEAVQQAIQSIIAVLPTIVDAIAPLIPQIVSMLLSMLPQIINAGIQILLSLIQGITEALPELIKLLPQIIKDMCNTILDNLGAIIDAGIELLMALVDGLVEALPELIDYIPEIIDKIVDVLVENLPKIVEAGITLIIKLAEGIIKAIPQLVAKIPHIITSLVTGIAKYYSKLFESGKNLLIKLKDGIWDNLSTLLSKVKEIPGKIKDKLLEGLQKIKDAGKDFMDGLWGGIKEKWEGLKDKVKNFGEGIVSKFKNVFGIHSPSRVMKEQVGKYLAEGIGVGFEDEMNTVAQDMANAIPTSFDTNIIANSGSSASVTNTYDNMVDAFKEALSEMKIELDDEVAGKFVENTVARAIYS